jgi:hypothetical protein
MRVHLDDLILMGVFISFVVVSGGTGYLMGKSHAHVEYRTQLELIEVPIPVASSAFNMQCFFIAEDES